MTITSRLAGLAAASLLATAVAAVPAGAESGSLKYTCKDPLNADRTFSVTADTSAPAAVKVGETFTPSVTAKVSVPEELRALLYDTAGARTVEGATNAQGKATTFGFSVNGAAGELAATVPVTPIPASGAFVVTATATGTPITASAAGSIKIAAGNFTAVLAGKNGTGNASLLSPYTIPCTLNAGQDSTVDTVAVTADGTPAAKVDSTTTARATYAKKAKKAVVKVAVKGSDGTAGTGKVKVTLKLGKKTTTVRAALNSKGKAKAVFKKVTKAGTYKVKVAYAGSDSQNPSKGRATVKVG